MAETGGIARHPDTGGFKIGNSPLQRREKVGGGGMVDSLGKISSKRGKRPNLHAAFLFSLSLFFDKRSFISAYIRYFRKFFGKSDP